VTIPVFKVALRFKLELRNVFANKKHQLTSVSSDVLELNWLAWVHRNESGMIALLQADTLRTECQTIAKNAASHFVPVKLNFVLQNLQLIIKVHCACIGFDMLRSLC
jgi:hypothetical protein